MIELSSPCQSLVHIWSLMKFFLLSYDRLVSPDGSGVLISETDNIDVEIKQLNSGYQRYKIKIQVSILFRKPRDSELIWGNRIISTLLSPISP